MAPATEIGYLPLKEGSYPDDATSAVGQKFKDIVSTIQAQDGCQRVYFGRQVEHPSIGTLLIDWDSIGHHEKFMASDAYKPFIDEISTLLAGPARLFHVHFDPHPPSVALADGGPFVTEVITAYFPTDYSTADQKAFDGAMQKLIEVIAEHAKGFKASAGGWVAEELDLPDGSGKAKGFIGLIGWESVEAHQKFRETQAFADNIHLLRNAKDVKTMSVFHVPAKEIHKS